MKVNISFKNIFCKSSCLGNKQPLNEEEKEKEYEKCIQRILNSNTNQSFYMKRILELQNKLENIKKEEVKKHINFNE